MKRFLKQTAQFILVALLVSTVLSNLIYQFVGPLSFDDYEAPELVGKLAPLCQSDADYNTVFIGSSKTYRQVQPIYFDSLRSGTSKSYNAAYAALFPFRSFEVIDQVQACNPQLSTYVIELTPLARVGDNFNSNPNIRLISSQRFGTAIDYARTAPKLNTRLQIEYILGYTKLMIYKYLGFGISKAVSLEVDTPEGLADSTITRLTSQAGFVSLEEEAKFTKGLQKRRNRLENNPDQPAKLAKNYLDESQKKSGPTPFFQELEKRAQKLQEAGAKVVFFIPPRQNKDAMALIVQQKARLLEKGYTVVDLANPENYPDLYTFEYSFDSHHLNDAGSRLMTKALADAIKPQN